MICAVCQKIIEFSYLGGDTCTSKCYKIQFWSEQIKAYNGHVVIVDGVFYRYYFTAPCYRKGELVKVLFDTGRKVMSRDLRRIGRIPKEYLDILPNNAKLIKRKKWRGLKRTK